MGTLNCVVHGSTMVIPAEHFDPLQTLTAISSERCTAVHGVPTMFIAQLSHPDFTQFDLQSLRTGIMAGSPCPIEVMREVIDRMGAERITIAYGLTEASPVITQTLGRRQHRASRLHRGQGPAQRGGPLGRCRHRP